MNMKPFGGRASCGTFRLDRVRFSRYLQDEFDELVGIEMDFEGGIAAAIESRFHDAREAGAILCPPGLEVIVYALDDSLIVAVREVDLPADLPVRLRQLATFSFETKYVIDCTDQSFEEGCAAIEELLVRATSLLPSFEALQSGERAPKQRGLRRLLALPRR